MFNGSRFNGAAYNAGSSSVRVLLASAVLAVSSTGNAEPLRTQYGNTDAPVEAAIHAPRAVAERAASTLIYPSATFDVSRPWDLATAEMLAVGELDPEHLVIRAGVASMEAKAVFGADAIRYAFFSDLIATAQFAPIRGRGIRPGIADIQAAAIIDALATREQPGNSALSVTASASFDGDVYAGGITTFEPYSDLFAEPHLNGIQPGWSQLEVIAALEANGDRMAGGIVDGQVETLFEAAALPGRGAQANEGLVTAELTAVWWTFNYETATLSAHASIEATPTHTVAVRSRLDAKASITAPWSLIVEPRESIVMSKATLTAAPWRIRPVRVSVGVTGTAYAFPYRTSYHDVTFDGIGSVIRNRLSVNITNPAPEHRQMVVPFEDRAMLIPYENRTMEVS
ncbi:MAG: hypothetical protein ACQEW0_16505 [Pseudomonadota bacterium]